MAISKLNPLCGSSSNLKTNFKAKIEIEDTENLLSEEDKKYFKFVGKRIGTDSDTIQIKLSGIKDSEKDPDVQYYDMFAKYVFKTNDDCYYGKTEASLMYSKNNKIIEKNLPEKVIERFLKRDLFSFWTLIE